VAPHPSGVEATAKKKGPVWKAFFFHLICAVHVHLTGQRRAGIQVYENVVYQDLAL
jgi:hypothetical protein